jgi:hypothetical protein
MSAVGDAEVREWIDRQAIEDLIHRYSDAVTRADWDQHEAVFAPDAILEVASPFDFRAEGARAIREQTSVGSAKLEFLIQTVDSSVIRLLGPDRAYATSTIHEMGRGMSPGPTGEDADVWLNWEQYGVYYDDVVKLEGEWKFAHRFCQPIYYLGTDALTGEAIAARSSLARSPLA